MSLAPHTLAKSLHWLGVTLAIVGSLVGLLSIMDNPVQSVMIVLLSLSIGGVCAAIGAILTQAMIIAARTRDIASAARSAAP